MHTHPIQTRHSADTLLLFSIYTAPPSFIPFPSSRCGAAGAQARSGPSATERSRRVFKKNPAHTHTHTRTANSNQLRLHIYAAAFCTWSTQSGKQHHRRRVAVLRLKKCTDFPTSTAPLLLFSPWHHRGEDGEDYLNIYICIYLQSLKKQTKERKWLKLTAWCALVAVSSPPLHTHTHTTLSECVCARRCRRGKKRMRCVRVCVCMHGYVCAYVSECVCLRDERPRPVCPSPPLSAAAVAKLWSTRILRSARQLSPAATQIVDAARDDALWAGARRALSSLTPFYFVVFSKWCTRLKSTYDWLLPVDSILLQMCRTTCRCMGAAFKIIEFKMFFLLLLSTLCACTCWAGGVLHIQPQINILHIPHSCRGDKTHRTVDTCIGFDKYSAFIN